MRSLQTGWHKLVYSYIHLLYESCMDHELREKLRVRAEYHRSKVFFE